MKKTIAIASCFILNTFAAVAQPTFTARLMEDLAGNFSYSYDLNNHGQIAGASRDINGDDYAVHWNADGTMDNTGIKGLARGINIQGNMAIWEDADDSIYGTTPKAAFWDKNTGKQDILLPGQELSYAIGINDHNQVVGRVWQQIDNEFSSSHFLWDNVNGATILPTPNGRDAVSHAKINNQGQITGFYGYEGNVKPYFWDPITGFHPIDVTADYGFNLGLNDMGKIAGALYDYTTSRYIPYTWDRENGVQFLPYGGEFDGGEFNGGFASGINRQNEMVGSLLYNDYEYSSAAFWDDQGHYEIDDLIDWTDPVFGAVHFTRASSINDRGQVAAEGIILETGEKSLFLLSRSDISQQVAEPAPLALLGLGLYGIMVRRRRLLAKAA